MVGTVTTHSYCVVKDGKAFEGSRENILSQICKYRIDENRRVHVKFDGYTEVRLISYAEVFTYDEICKDMIEVIFSKLPNYGYRIYRDIGF
jgi:hypothetical protein